jgi:hypothetical protein
VRYGTETIVWNFEADPTANGSRPRRQQKKQALLKPHENETAHAAGSAKITRKSQPFPAAATAKHRRRRHGLLRQPRRGHCSASPGIRFSHSSSPLRRRGSAEAPRGGGEAGGGRGEGGLHEPPVPRPLRGDPARVLQ